MFDIGWTEMALIAVVAVIVIGPKELPKVMRELGIWVSRARSMSRVFMQQLEEMSRETGIEEVRKEAEALRRLNPAREIEKAVDPDGVIARQAEDFAKVGSATDTALPKPADPMAPLGEPVAGQPPTIEGTAVETPSIEPPAPATSAPSEPAPAADTPGKPRDAAP